MLARRQLSDANGKLGFGMIQSSQVDEVLLA